MPLTYDKKKLRKRMKRKPKVANAFIQRHWNDKQSVAKNLRNFGLSNNPNKSILTGFINTQPQIYGQETNVKNKRSKKKPKQSHVAEMLEKQANKSTGIKQIKLPPGTVTFLTGLIEKYGDNYKEMTKDPKNVYQMTWKQIRAKILTFKSIKEYEHLMPRSIAES